VHIPAEQLFLAPVPQHPQTARVGERAPSLRVDAVDSLRRGVEDQAETVFAFVQRRVRFLQLRGTFLHLQFQRPDEKVDVVGHCVERSREAADLVVAHNGRPLFEIAS